MIYKFTEVLNDLVNYFILGDILLLENWKGKIIFQMIWRWSSPQMKAVTGRLLKEL